MNLTFIVRVVTVTKITNFLKYKKRIEIFTKMELEKKNM